MEVWNHRKSSELYHINSWGNGYFGINEKGHVEVSPYGRDKKQPRVDLKELVDDLRGRGLSTPLILRFPNVLESQITAVAGAFTKTMATYNYEGQYRGVYPIKVNQQRYLVEEFMKYGRETHLGLEAGSKPELLVALAMVKDPEALIICNGFKDLEYIETALLSQKLGRNTILVVDRFKELEMIISAGRSLGIKPRIGFRVKLASKGQGKWQESSGAKSKFGLASWELVRGVQVLKKAKLLSSLELLHFHMGSQVSALRAVKEAVGEAAQFFVELYKLGAPLKYIDIGGGLAVDYDGSQSNWDNSRNYTVKEYASDVVWTLMQSCKTHNIPHPDIISESGRALAAYSSMLVFNAIDANVMQDFEMPTEKECENHELLVEFRQLIEFISLKNLNESIQDAFKLRDDATSLFNLGYLGLQHRSVLERLFQCFCGAVVKIAKNLNKVPEEVEKIQSYLTDSYFCNFSLFKSAPDTWAVNQLFPIMPIHRLNEEPKKRGVLLDLTCDSDGKIDEFIDQRDDKKALELHELREGEDYLLGMFLVGAYQEVLGDFHNLFGDTDAVHVSVTDAGYALDHVIEGDKIYEVLEYMEYDRGSLQRQIRDAIEDAIANKKISLDEARLLLRHYEESLNNSTYLEDGGEKLESGAREAFRRLNKKLKLESRRNKQKNK